RESAVRPTREGRGCPRERARGGDVPRACRSRGLVVSARGPSSISVAARLLVVSSRASRGGLGGVGVTAQACSAAAGRPGRAIGREEGGLDERDRIGDAPKSIRRDVDLVAGDAWLGKNDIDKAGAHYEAYLAIGRHPAQWTTIALRLAGALLQHPSAARAEKA